MALNDTFIKNSTKHSGKACRLSSTIDFQTEARRN